MRQFVCKNCGSSELGYSSFMKHITPVSIDDGRFHYDSALEYIIYDVTMEVNEGFCCNKCGVLIWHCGDVLTEADLLHYLTAPEEKLKEEELLFWSSSPDCDAHDDNDGGYYPDDEENCA